MAFLVFSFSISIFQLSCNIPISTKDKIIGKWELVAKVSMTKGMEMTKLDTEFTQNGNVIITTGIDMLGYYTEGTASSTYKIDGEMILYGNGAVVKINGDIMEIKVPISSPEVLIKLKKKP